MNGKSAALCSVEAQEKNNLDFLSAVPDGNFSGHHINNRDAPVLQAPNAPLTKVPVEQATNG